MNKIKENVAYHLPTISHLLDFLVIADKEELKWDDGKKAIEMAEYLVEHYKENMAIIYYNNALWHEDINEMRKQGFEVVEWKVVYNPSPDFALSITALIMLAILGSVLNKNTNKERETKISVGDKVRPISSFGQSADDKWLDLNGCHELKCKYADGKSVNINTLYTVVAIDENNDPFEKICAIEDSNGCLFLIRECFLIKMQI